MVARVAWDCALASAQVAVRTRPSTVRMSKRKVGIRFRVRVRSRVRVRVRSKDSKRVRMRKTRRERLRG